MNKEETRQTIYKIFDFIDGTYDWDEEYHCILGHPALYFFHSKEELEAKINEFLDSKENFDKYEIYYFVNKMIKYLLKSYDSHTKLYMKTKQVPIKFKYIDGKIYLINISEPFKQVKFSEVTHINGIDINIIKNDIEAMTCYSTKEYLEVEIEYKISQPDILKTLPCFSNYKEATKITYTLDRNGLKESIEFDLNNLQKYPMYQEKIKQNYTYQINDNIMVLNYNSCKDFDAMKDFVSEISKVAQDKNISKFIVDLRGNSGGNSNIIKPLIEFLKGNDIITLVDEKVFSAGRMACCDLSKIGSYTIGTNMSTTLCAFGNNPKPYLLNDLDFEIRRSTKYFLYDEGLKCHSFNKENFFEYFKTPENFESIDQKLYSPDMLIYRPSEDYITGRDSQLEVAINYLKMKEKNNQI